MSDCNINKDIQNKVCSELRNIGYSKRISGCHPITIEGKVVSDADICDVLGANGILRVYAFCTKNGKLFFDRNIFPNENMNPQQYTNKITDSSVTHIFIFEKILKLKGLMLTDSGKIEAKKRHKIEVDFLYHFFDEEEASE